MERLLRGEAPAVRRQATRRRPRSTSATRTAAASPTSCARAGRRCCTFGLADDADVRAEELELGARGARFRVGEIELETRLRGRFNVENVLGAVAAARLLGIADDAIAAGHRVGRGRPRPLRGGRRGPAFAVIVDYAHKPDALENVLRTARELAAGPRDLRLRLRRRPRPRQAAADGPDRRASSPTSRSSPPTTRAARIRRRSSTRSSRAPRRRGGRAGPARGDRSARSAAADEGDVVVIAGKGHEQGQEFARRTRPVRRPRGRARGAARARSARVIPLALDELDRARSRPAGRAPWASEITGVQVDSRRVEQGDLFVAVGRGADFLDARVRARRRRDARPRRRRSPRSPRSAGRPRPHRRARRRASPARRARRRRRTSSPRSALRPPARSPPRRATTTRSACR